MTTVKEFITFLEKKVLPNLNITDGSHDISHFYRVRRNGLLLADDLSAQSMNCDRTVVEVACLLHDVVNLPKNSPDRKNASELASLKAYGICVGYDAEFMTEEWLTKMREAIKYHSFSAEMERTEPLKVCNEGEPKRAPSLCEEALCVQDADRLDAIGPIGIARCFYVCGSLGGAICDTVDPLAKNRPLDDRKYGLDHFEVKLCKLEGMMKTPLGRQLAKKRTETLREFREHLAKNPTRENPIYVIAWIFHQLGKDQKPIGPLSLKDQTADPYLSKFIDEFNVDLC